MSTTPFWYGKLPSVGDFASRRWPEHLIEPWDTWLATQIDAQRCTLGDSWLNAYLNSATWRFVLPPHTLAVTQVQPIAGVLMPSVDKVGRYFPLTLAAHLPRMPQTLSEAESLMAWLHKVDDLAADALHDDWSIDALEGALGACAAPTWPAAHPALPPDVQAFFDGASDMVALTPLNTRPATLALLGQSLMGAAMQATPTPLTWWWSEPDAQPDRRQILLSRDLPRGPHFAALWGMPTAAHAALVSQTQPLNAERFDE